MNLILGYFLCDISNDYICLSFKIRWFFLVQYDLLSIDQSIVHFIETSISFIFGVKVEITKAFRFSCLLVEHYLSISEIVSSVFEEFENIIVKCGWCQVSNVETQFVIILGLGSLLTLINETKWELLVLHSHSLLTRISCKIAHLTHHTSSHLWVLLHHHIHWLSHHLLRETLSHHLMVHIHLRMRVWPLLLLLNLLLGWLLLILLHNYNAD